MNLTDNAVIISTFENAVIFSKSILGKYSVIFSEIEIIKLEVMKSAKLSR